MTGVTSPAENRLVAWRYAYLLLVSAVVLCADQVSKALVTDRLAGGRVVKLLGGAIWLVYTRNRGAAFSIFQTGGLLFALIAVAVSAGILIYFRRVAHSPVAVRAALGLVLGGAMGNLIDRVRLGFVVDFVDLRWWPVFNIADSAVVVGVLLLAVSSVFAQPESSGD